MADGGSGREDGSSSDRSSDRSSDTSARADDARPATAREHEPEPSGGSVSIRAIVRQYEQAHDEVAILNSRIRRLRNDMKQMRGDVESFMRERNLERIGTRDGRLVVRMLTKTVSARPGKKQTVQCVQDTLGETHPDLASDIVRRLYDENRQVRTYTRFDKRRVGETRGRTE